MAKFCQKIAFSIAVVVFISFGSSDGRTYFNSFDERLDRECGGTEAISSIYSYHDNGPEDRRFGFKCRKVPYASGQRTCDYSDNWENSFDGLLSFHCPPNLFIVGMESVHDDRVEDRRWKFDCCRFGDVVLHGCELSDWTNDIDGVQDFRVPTDHVITGVFSYHNNRAEDRQYKYNICKVGSFSSAIPKYYWRQK